MTFPHHYSKSRLWYPRSAVPNYWDPYRQRDLLEVQAGPKKVLMLGVHFIYNCQCQKGYFKQKYWDSKCQKPLCCNKKLAFYRTKMVIELFPGYNSQNWKKCMFFYFQTFLKVSSDANNFFCKPWKRVLRPKRLGTTTLNHCPSILFKELAWHTLSKSRFFVHL